MLSDGVTAGAAGGTQWQRLLLRQEAHDGALRKVGNGKHLLHGRQDPTLGECDELQSARALIGMLLCCEVRQALAQLVGA